MNGLYVQQLTEATRLELLLVTIVELGFNVEDPQVYKMLTRITATDTGFAEAYVNVRKKYDLRNALNRVNLGCLLLLRQCQSGCIDKSLPPVLDRGTREAIRLLQEFQRGGQ